MFLYNDTEQIMNVMGSQINDIPEMFMMVEEKNRKKDLEMLAKQRHEDREFCNKLLKSSVKKNYKHY